MGTWTMGSTTDHRERHEQILALKRGVELGMNLIDTAEIYGNGQAEQLVGEAFRGQRDSVFIATKVSAGHLHHDDLIAACNRSLERLEMRHIDLYQVHWPNSAIPIRETISAMEQLVREGKVRYIGISNFDVEETKEAQAALAKNEIVSNQVEYSLTNRSVEADLLPYCTREGITVVAYSPLARGNIPRLEILQQLLEKHHMTPAQLMLNWVTRHENVVAIPKSAKIRHAEENANAVSMRFSQNEYAQISRAF
jgi:diketogulonate reductase-like aldo/keto reductase